MALSDVQEGPSLRAAGQGWLLRTLLLGAIAVSLVSCQTGAAGSEATKAPTQAGPTTQLTEAQPTGTIVAASPTSVPPQAADPCDPDTPWSIEFGLTGGLAGVDQQLAVDGEGNLVAKDRRQGQEIHDQVSSDRIGMLTMILADLCPFEVSRVIAPCADCFEYTVSIRWGEHGVAMQANDASLAESPFGALIQELRMLLGEVLSGAP